jgi:hypothetical protein
LDALNDCLSNDLSIPDPGGLLLQLLFFDSIHAAPEELRNSATKLLDLAARAIREYMLIGRRFIVFVQTNNENVSYENLGAVAATWNRHEWLRAKRT